MVSVRLGITRDKNIAMGVYYKNKKGEKELRFSHQSLTIGTLARHHFNFKIKRNKISTFEEGDYIALSGKLDPVDEVTLDEFHRLYKQNKDRRKYERT